MSEDYRTLCQAAQHALMEGNAKDAFRKFRPVLRYPGMVEGQAELVEALAVFARISAVLAGDDFTALVQAVVREPDDVNALYKLGYELIEQRLPDLAATVLARAYELAPGEEAILTELVAALEEDMRYHDACKVLSASPTLLKQSFLCRYLLAFNSIMIGDLATARSLSPDLQQSQEDEDYRFMAARIAGMIRRADALAGVSALDKRDLRGWHFVLNGGLLLHLSPYGFDEGMNGRYAFVQDSPDRCLEGMRRLIAVLDTLQLSPPRIFVLPERRSAILAHALAQMLHLPLVPWPEEGSGEPGLIVAYDAGELDDALLTTLFDHRPGQILWSHASCWTRTQPFAPDITTFLYQFNHSPWDARTIVDPQTKQLVEQAPDERGIEVLAVELMQTELASNALDDLPVLQTLVQAVATVTGDDAAGALRSSGRRRTQWAGSPVPSSRFA